MQMTTILLSENNTAALPDSLERFGSNPCHPFRRIASSGSDSVLKFLQPKDPSFYGCDECGIRALETNNTITSSPFESSRSLESLQNYLRNRSTGWSVSVWLSPSSARSVEDALIEPILTMGFSSHFSAKNGGNETAFTGSCAGYYFQLAQYRNYLVVRFQDIDGEQSCRTVVLRQVSLDSLPHPVQATVAVSPTTSSIYVNDQAIIENMPYAPDMSLVGWAQASQSSLQLFSADYPDDYTGVFRGSVQQVTLFDEVLSSDQVFVAFQEGILAAPQLIVSLSAETIPDSIRIAQDEKERIRIWVGSNVASTPLLPLSIQLVSLPSRGQVFLTPSDREPLHASNGTIPLETNSTGTWVEYQLTSLDYFSLPAINANGEAFEVLPEFLEYRVVSLDPQDKRLLATSPTVTQMLDVQHVNHRPSWDAPEQATFVAIVSGRPIFNVRAIRLEDHWDRSMDRVRIDVWASQGSLTLDHLHAGLADFDSCYSRTYSDWQCEGNGVADRFMTFLALPDQVELILSNLHYRSNAPGSADKVRLAVYDGAGGSCPAPEEHYASTVVPPEVTTLHRECFHEETFIQIPAVDIPNQFDSGENNFLGIPNTDFSNFGLPDLIFWVIVFFVLGSLICCLKQCCPNCLAQGSAVVPDDYDSEDEEEECDTDTDCGDSGDEESQVSQTTRSDQHGDDDLSSTDSLPPV